MKVLDRLPHDEVDSARHWHEGVDLVGYHPESNSLVFKSGDCRIVMTALWLDDLLRGLLDQPLVYKGKK